MPTKFLYQILQGGTVIIITLFALVMSMKAVRVICFLTQGAVFILVIYRKHTLTSEESVLVSYIVSLFLISLVLDQYSPYQFIS
jgi:hypothetical protein